MVQSPRTLLFDPLIVTVDPARHPYDPPAPETLNALLVLTSFWMRTDAPETLIVSVLIMFGRVPIALRVKPAA
jgi:hypothetical protein